MLFPLPGVLFLPLLIWLPTHILFASRITALPAGSSPLARPIPEHLHILFLSPPPQAAAGGQGQAH